jgi:hypothetical protein
MVDTIGMIVVIFRSFLSQAGIRLASGSEWVM